MLLIVAIANIGTNIERSLNSCWTAGLAATFIVYYYVSPDDIDSRTRRPTARPPPEAPRTYFVSEKVKEG